MDEPILMKLYTVVVYNLRMYMKEDNTSPKNIKGEIKGDKYLCRLGVVLCDLSHSYCFVKRRFKNSSTL